MVNNTTVAQSECTLQRLLLQAGNVSVVKDLSASSLSCFRKEGLRTFEVLHTLFSGCLRKPLTLQLLKR